MGVVRPVGAYKKSAGRSRISAKGYKKSEGESVRRGRWHKKSEGESVRRGRWQNKSAGGSRINARGSKKSAGWSRINARGIFRHKTAFFQKTEGNSIQGETILDFERPRYSFGRSWTGDRLFQTKIKLPISENKEPDWKYIEDYIKSLPYGNLCL
jgi:hypothetical protein